MEGSERGNGIQAPHNPSDQKQNLEGKREISFGERNEGGKKKEGIQGLFACPG